MQGIYMNLKTEDLVVMYQNTKAEDLLSEIVERNNGLIYSWARDYRNIPNYDEEDLVEEAVIACWKAVNAFDPTRGYAFTTCLKGCVYQSLNRLYNEATRKKRFTGSEHISYDELVEINREGGTEADSSFAIECKDYSSLEVREFLESIGGTIKEVAVLLYDGMTKGEVAKALGITPASTTYHLKKLQQAYIAYFGEAV